MQFPRINRDNGGGAGPGGPRPSGLGAFYAKSGVQAQRSPQRPVGNRPMAMGAQPILRGGMGGPMGMPPMMPYGQVFPQPQSQMGMFPRVSPSIGAPVAPPAAMGAHPVMGSMMNMQAQLMQKRRANMALKQRAVQQQQQLKQQRQMQGDEPTMGIQPYNPGGRGDFPQQQQQEVGGGGPSYLQPQRPQPEPPKDPRSEAFDMGQKLAQMEQFMKEAQAEKEEAKQIAEQQQKEEEEQQQQPKSSKKVSTKASEKRKENEKDKDQELEPEELSLLDKLESEAREKIAEGNKALHELDMTDEELRMAADAAGKEEMREKFKNRLDNQMRRGKGKLPIQPRWRHVLDGNPSPPKERILRGKALLRACAWGIVIMFVRPNLSIRRRKLIYKEKEEAEFRRTLDAFGDACTVWWGSVVKIPVASLQEGNVPALRPKKRSAFSNTTITPELLTALKVRVRGIIKALKNARMPPEYITSFLITLLDDDNYFYEGFLYPEEAQILDLNDFGGTRGMVRELHEDDAGDRDVTKKCKKGQVVLGENSAKKRKVDASRARLLLQNFIFLRILINKCVLSPWLARISRRPKHAQVKTQVDNLRVVATVLYMALRECNKRLPVVEPDLDERYAHRLQAPGDEDKEGEGEGDGKGGGENQQKKSSGDGDGDDDDNQGGGGAGMDDPDTEYKEGTMMYYLFGPRLTSEAAASHRKRTAEDLLREDLTFAVGTSFVSLQHTVGSLLDAAEFAEVKEEVESWLPELAADIDDYTDRLLVHVLEKRPNVLHDDFHELVDGHEDAPEGELSTEEAAARVEAKLTARREEKEAKDNKKKDSADDEGPKTDGEGQGGPATGRKPANAGVVGTTVRKISNAGPGARGTPARNRKPSVAKLDFKGAGLVPPTARSQAQDSSVNPTARTMQSAAGK